MKEYFKKWFQQFWDKHGERNYYLAWATLFGVCFIVAGVVLKSHREESLGDQLIGAGGAILIGVAQMCFNKSRSPEDKQVTITPEANDETTQ